MSTNISKQKREDLLVKIGELRTYVARSQDNENKGNLLTYLSELEKEIRIRKYGLIFEEHREGIDVTLATHTPVLTEDKDSFINNNNQMNAIIEGDNLSALRLLLKTHSGKIDLIYIDPPYNTGSDNFIYDDKRVDKNDAYRHSKWLSFMQRRLSVAFHLLSQKGFLFMSINDREQPGLKLLCDSIFGEDNFIANIAIVNNPKGRSDDKYFATAHEYLLVYRKSDKGEIGGFEPEENVTRRYNKTDEYGRKYREIDLRKTGDQDLRSDRPKMFYYFFFDKESGDFFPSCEDMDDEKFIKIVPIRDDGKDGRWRWGIDTAKEKLSKLIPKYMPTRKIWGIMEKDYLDERDLVKPTTAWTSKDVNSERGTEEFIKNLGFSKTDFQNPKPIGTIFRIIKIASGTESIILDFFAGSGTTGQAVMQINREDGGNRRFILCTNNENGICREVTYERIKRVIARDGYETSLKYYQVGYVPISEKMYYEYADELLLHIRELVELENGINFTGNAEIAIVLTDEELVDFITNIETFGKCQSLYIGHNVLLDGKQEALFKKNNIRVNIIPDYYYQELEG